MTETKSGYRTLENTGYGPKSDYRFPDVPPGAVVKFTLVDDLVSYWPLNEQSGQRNDVVGANHLTDNNTVGAVNRGPVGTAASFVAANGETLSRADTPSLRIGVADVTFSFWYKRTIDQGAAFPVLAKGVQADYTFDTDTTGTGIRFYTINGGGYPVAAWGAPLVLNQWYHVVGWRDGVAQTNNIQVNGGTPIATAPAAIVDGDTADAFAIASYKGSQNHTDCVVDEVAIWNRVLTAGERTSLFAAGNGKTYADLTTAEKVGLVSYWNLDEVSGTRVDSHGSNNLTDNNTVGSVNSGPSGVVARFVKADNEYLQAAENQTFLSDNTWSVGWWLKFDASKLTSNVPSQDIISAHVGAGNDLSFIVRYSYQADGHVPFTIYVGDGAAFDTPVNGYILNADANWHYFLLVRDGTSVKLYRDGSTSGYLSNASLAPIDASGTSSKVSSEAQPVRLGKSAGNGAADGFLSNVGIWSVAVASGEQTSLFNSGVGKRYADLTAGEKTGLVSYWDLSEASGTRIDSHGANDLTDNNTVGSVINAGGAMDGAAASFVAASSESLSGTLDLAANFTLAFWFNRTNQVAHAFPFVVGTDTRAFEIYTYAAGANVVFGSETEDTTVVGTIFPAGQWVHCMVTFDGTALKLYTDNDLKGTDASFTLGANATISFGGTAVGYQSGLIDEVAIWSRVLTSDERAELYNAGAGFFYNATTEDFE